MKKTKELNKLLAVVFAGAIAVTALQVAVNQAHLRIHHQKAVQHRVN